MKKFNYVVAQQWTPESDQIGCYAYGSEVQYGTMKDAKKFLKYVKQKSTDENRKYKIFMVVELPQ